jgi:hypothetical protein
MNQSGKPFAPKPIKKLVSSIKLDSNSDKCDFPSSNAPNSINRPYHRYQHHEPSLNITKSSKSVNQFKDEDYFTFETQLNSDLSDTAAKNEILSILCLRESTSTCFQSCLFSTKEKDDEISEINKDIIFDQSDMDDVPVRSSNPFYKNFSDKEENGMENVNVFRDNLTKLTTTLANAFTIISQK